MPDGYKHYSSSDDDAARASISVVSDFYHARGYDCIEQSSKRQQKHSTHRHRITGETLLIASEMRFYHWDKLWTGCYPDFHLPVRKDGTWFDKWISVGPGLKKLVLINAADVYTAKIKLVNTRYSEQEPFIYVDCSKVGKYQCNKTGVWMFDGTIL